MDGEKVRNGQRLGVEIRRSRELKAGNLHPQFVTHEAPEFKTFEVPEPKWDSPINTHLARRECFSSDGQPKVWVGNSLHESRTRERVVLATVEDRE